MTRMLSLIAIDIGMLSVAKKQARRCSETMQRMFLVLENATYANQKAFLNTLFEPRTMAK